MAFEFVELVESGTGASVWINRDQVIGWVVVDAGTQRIFLNDDGTCIVASTSTSLATTLNFNVATLVGAFVAFTLRSSGKTVMIGRKHITDMRAFDANNTRIGLVNGAEVVVTGNLATTAAAVNFNLLNL